MKSHESIWELYLKEGFQELKPGKDSEPNQEFKIDEEKHRIDDLFDCDTTEFNQSLEEAVRTVSRDMPWGHDNYISYSDNIWKEYVLLKKAEETITHLEKRYIADKYFYGHAIRVLKSLDNLDSKLPEMINKEYCHFQSYREDIKKGLVLPDKEGQESINRTAKNIMALIGLANDRHIDVSVDGSGMSILTLKDMIQTYQESVSEKAAIEHQFEIHELSYQKLKLADDDKKYLKILRRPVSKRWGLFKGHILKECHRIKYDVGIEKCEILSRELKYVKDNLSEVSDRKQELESRLESLNALVEDLKSYITPLSTTQLKNISTILIKETDISGMIYLKKIEEELVSLYDSNRKGVDILLNRQKSYILALHETNRKMLDIVESDGHLFEKSANTEYTDGAINRIGSGREELEKYRPQMNILGMNESITDDLLNRMDSVRNKFAETKKSYDARPKYVVIQSSPPPEMLISTSMVDKLKIVGLPDDTRYWNISAILQGRKGVDGWLNRLKLVDKELGLLKGQCDLQKTDYVLDVADIVESDYKDGYIGEIADISPESRPTIEATINHLYSFGREVSLNR